MKFNPEKGLWDLTPTEHTMAMVILNLATKRGTKGFDKADAAAALAAHPNLTASPQTAPEWVSNAIRCLRAGLLDDEVLVCTEDDRYLLAQDVEEAVDWYVSRLLDIEGQSFNLSVYMQAGNQKFPGLIDAELDAVISSMVTTRKTIKTVIRRLITLLPAAKAQAINEILARIQ